MYNFFSFSKTGKKDCFEKLLLFFFPLNRLEIYVYKYIQSFVKKYANIYTILYSHYLIYFTIITNKSNINK